MPTTKLVCPDDERTVSVNLKNPFIAGFLSWLVPGLGHYYQGRYPKAFIFFLCVIPMFVVGCALGSSAEVGIARNVYWSWRWSAGDMRLWWLAQAPLSFAAVPSGIQAWHVNSQQPAPLRKFMAPPRLWTGDKTGVAPVLDEIRQKLPLFELGTYLTAFAGLMNLLVIFDAVGGPFVERRAEKKEGVE